jgi:hypothetical protein
MKLGHALTTGMFQQKMNNPEQGPNISIDQFEKFLEASLKTIEAAEQDAFVKSLLYIALPDMRFKARVKRRFQKAKNLFTRKNKR